MGTRYQQLCLEDRCEIARLPAEGRSLRQIAAALDRAPSTISRELKRNFARLTGYGPSTEVFCQKLLHFKCESTSQLSPE
jgi:transposase, IS30 family